MASGAIMSRIEYIFYDTDASFDYLGPFGVETYHYVESHGFNIEMDVNDNINLNTIEGFGDFVDIENCKTLESLYKYILDNLDNVQESEEDSELSRRELLEELLSTISDGIDKKCIIQSK